MSSIARIPLPQSLWERVRSLAQSQCMKPTEWLACAVEQAAQRGTDARPAQERDVQGHRSPMLELTIRHFQHLYPSPLEARKLARAIRSAVREGGPIRVGPLGRCGRSCIVERRDERICLRSIAGRIELSPAEALALAEALTGPYDKPAVMRLAA